MLKLDFISARGDVLPLANNKLFALAHVDGQTVAETSVATAIVGGLDGDTVNSIQATARTITLDLRIKGGVDVEDAKREILKFVKLKQQGGLLWTQNERSVNITGIVETVEMPRWTNGVVMQVSLHCEQPFWEDVDDVIQQINEAISLHYFTDTPACMLYFTEEGAPLGEYDTIRAKEFYNAGDVSVGVEITLVAHETVTNPVIYDRDGRFFGLGYEYTSHEEDEDGNMISALISNPFIMQAGDNVIITTHKGQKRVMHNGVVIYDKIKPGSTWLQLATGDNKFTIDSDDESISNMSFSIAYKQRYI